MPPGAFVALVEAAGLYTGSQKKASKLAWAHRRLVTLVDDGILSRSWMCGGYVYTVRGGEGERLYIEWQKRTGVYKEPTPRTKEIVRKKLPNAGLTTFSLEVTMRKSKYSDDGWTASGKEVKHLKMSLPEDKEPALLELMRRLEELMAGGMQGLGFDGEKETKP